MIHETSTASAAAVGPATAVPTATRRPLRPAPTATASALYGRSLRDAGSGLVLREADGQTGTLPVRRYLGALEAADLDVLGRVHGPVLDVGCGPGRHVVALLARGIDALGVDESPVACAVARERGATVVQGCVFRAVPDPGRWGTALLLDGNIGIGGRPARLLAHLARLLRPEGQVLAEFEAPGTQPRGGPVRLEDDTAVSDWFPWARVAADGVDALAAAAGLHVTDTWEVERRWFARLVAR